MRKDPFTWRVMLAFCAIMIASISCNALPTRTIPGPSATSTRPIASSAVLPTAIPTNTPTPKATMLPSPSATALPSWTQTQRVSHTPGHTSTTTITPTYAVLQGKVLQRANCRYGPGAPYLYKYGLLPDTPMDVIGRNDAGTWLLIQARGGSNPCWIKASLMEVQGDLMSAEPIYIPLPLSPYYGALSGVAAVRQEDDVIVSWHPLSLRVGDEVDLVIEAPYIIEAWVCRDGQLVFIPVGAYTNMVTIHDESGCSEPSHARLLGAEKHGYTPWVEVPWPEPQE